MAKTADPNQTAPVGVVWFESTPFACFVNPLKVEQGLIKTEYIPQEEDVILQRLSAIGL